LQGWTAFRRCHKLRILLIVTALRLDQRHTPDIMSESQDKIAPPTVTAVQGYGLGYSLYLHSTAWLLRKAVQQVSGNGATIDKFINVDTPGLGEGHVKVAICIPEGHKKEDSHSKPFPLLLVAEGGGFVLGQPTDGEHIIRPLSDDVSRLFAALD
jgi:hypothetical protein